MKKVSFLQQVRKESWHITICVRQFANNNIRLLLHPEPIQYDILDPVLRAAMAQNKAYICTTYKVRRALIASKEALYDLSKRRLIKKN